MVSQIPEEIHVHRYMLLEFHKGSNATVANKNICDVYPSALDVRKCQRWFFKVQIRAQVEANPCQTIEEMSNPLNQPSSTIQEHLHLVKQTELTDL
ncbi:UNVERIFIED_CONTAM: hypothetical protein NCL1_62919 [Trichonephila clavipes]